VRGVVVVRAGSFTDIKTSRCCDTHLQEAVGVGVGVGMEHDVISNSNILKKIVKHLMCCHHLIRSMTVTPDVLLLVIASPHTIDRAIFSWKYFYNYFQIICTWGERTHIFFVSDI
jgi:hypothetical protein